MSKSKPYTSRRFQTCIFTRTSASRSSSTAPTFTPPPRRWASTSTTSGFWDIFRKRSRLIRAIYYTALLEDAEYSPIKPLIDWLDYNGYRVVTKPAKEFTDAMGRRKVKGNMDIELAIDVMQLADQLDHIVLFSGDGDFRSLVAAVQAKGRRVTVVSTLTTQPADDRRRPAPPDRPVHRPERPARRDRPRSLRERRERPVAPSRPRATASRTSPISEPMPIAVSRRATARSARASCSTGMSSAALHPDWFNAPVPSFGAADAATADRRAGAGRAGRQPHGPPLHRRFRGRPALRDAERVRLRAKASTAPTRMTG